MTNSTVRRRFTLACFLVAGAGALATRSSTDAAPLRVPASLYPQGAHIAPLPRVSNHRMDCLWNFFCEGGVPLFHFTTEDGLHRLDGWAQTGRWNVTYHNMGFMLFVSHYSSSIDGAGRPWAAAALADFVSAAGRQGYRALHHLPRSLQALPHDRLVALTLLTGRDGYVLVGLSLGSVEVEGIATFRRTIRGDSWLARSDLIRQAAAALSYERSVTRTQPLPAATHKMSVQHLEIMHRLHLNHSFGIAVESL